MMVVKVILLLALGVAVYSAEISSSYSLLEKHTAFKPDLKTEPVDHGVNNKNLKEEHHPIYRAEEHGRARIEPVKPLGSIVKHHDMLSDQPSGATEVNRIDNLAIPGYGFVAGPAEVAYPDIPYAPGYGYDSTYGASNSYDNYNSNPMGNYILEPDTTAFGLLWSQVPDARTMVSIVGRTISWIFSSIFVIMLGSFLTVGVCSYTNLCSITFNGVGPIHEEMRSLVTPERLEKISNAADFVKNAIDKYQKIQHVSDVTGARRRRSL